VRKRLAVGLVVFTLSFLLLPAVPALAAGTPVNGNITTDTRWTTKGSPYYLNQQYVAINAGVTLTIDPGVWVVANFGWSTTLIVQGTLNAVGTSRKFIHFTSAQGYSGTGAPGQWWGVRFSGNGTGLLDYTEFTYGGAIGSSTPYNYGVIEHASSSSPVIDHSRILFNNNTGVQSTGSGIITVRHSMIADNTAGVAVSGTVNGAASVTDSTIYENSWVGFLTNHSQWPARQTVLQNSNLVGNDSAIRLQEAGQSDPGGPAPASLYPSGTTTTSTTTQRTSLSTGT
jgi:hypothetical protein